MPNYNLQILLTRFTSKLHHQLTPLCFTVITLRQRKHVSGVRVQKQKLQVWLPCCEAVPAPSSGTPVPWAEPFPCCCPCPWTQHGSPTAITQTIAINNFAQHTSLHDHLNATEINTKGAFVHARYCIPNTWCFINRVPSEEQQNTWNNNKTHFLCNTTTQMKAATLKFNNRYLSLNTLSSDGCVTKATKQRKHPQKSKKHKTDLPLSLIHISEPTRR